jgi:integrase
MPQPKNKAVFLKLTKEQVMDAAVEAAAATVTAGTFSDYKDVLRTLSDNGQPRNYEGLLTLVMARRPAYAVATVRKMISALSLMNGAQMLEEGMRELSPSERRHLIRAAQGQVLLYGRPSEERGSITKDMLDQLINLMTVHKVSAKLRFAVQLCFATSSREDQMRTLMRQDFKKDEQGLWYLEVQKDHDPTATRKDERKTERRTIHAFIQPELNRVLSGLQHPVSFVVGNAWQKDVVSKYIKLAAESYSWDGAVKLKWCIHSLRHGSAGTANELDDEEVTDYTGHSSERMGAHYARSNEERQEEVQQRVQRGSKAKQMGPELSALMRETAGAGKRRGREEL